MPAEDKVCQLFSEHFYSELAQGTSASEAFHDAVLAVKNTAGYSLPFQWARFFRYGK